MPEHYTRNEWGAKPARGGPGPMSPSQVVGVALHWPASTTPVRGFDAVSAALRGWQAYHQGPTLNWSDIGYQVAIDQDGNRYELRGFRTQSGANGSSTVNKAYGAILCIVAQGEKPTPELVQGVRDAVASFRTIYPRGKVIVGHSDIRPEPTACPGPDIKARIDSGLLDPRPPQAPTRGPAVDRALDTFIRTRDELRTARRTATEAGQLVKRKRIRAGIDAAKAGIRALREINPR